MQRRPVQYRNRRVVGPSSELVQPDRGLICYLNSKLGVGRSYASVDPDLGTWTSNNVTVGGDSSGYTLLANSTGAAARRVSTATGAETPHPMSSQQIVTAGSGAWLRCVIGGKSAWVNPTTGAIGTNLMDTTPAVTDLGGGEFQINCSQNVSVGSGMWIAPVDTDGGTMCTASSVGEILLTARDVSVTQVRAADIYSQAPATGPVASNINTAEQPYYGDGTGGLVADGVDDWLAFSGLSSGSTDYTIVAALSMAATSGINRFAFYSLSPQRIAFGRRSTGEIAIYDATAHLVLGSSAALPMSVLSMQMSGASGSVAVEIDNVPQVLDDPTWDAGYTIGGSNALFATDSGTANLETSLKYFGIWDRLLPPGEYLAAKQVAAAAGQVVLP